MNPTTFKVIGVILGGIVLMGFTGFSIFMFFALRSWLWASALAIGIGSIYYLGKYITKLKEEVY